MSATTYERYPTHIVVLSVGLALVLYALGAYLLSRLGLGYAIAYLLLSLAVEANVLRKSCVDCHYYGVLCGTGKGALCARVLRRGDPQRFATRQATWRDVAPDFAVALLPLLGGVVLLVRSFAWGYLAVMVLIVALQFGGNAVVRGNFLCRHCKQRELGCPAARLLGGSAGGA